MNPYHTSVKIIDSDCPKSYYFVPFDLETTGLRPDRDRIIQLGWIIFDNQFNIVEKKQVIGKQQG